MALPCASAKRSRLRPEVFVFCLSVRRRPSPRERAIIREVAIVELSRFSMQASSSRGHSILLSAELWSTVRMEQGEFGGISCLLRSDWSLRWPDVWICADASEKASHSRFVKDAASWRQRLVEFQGGQGSREAPGPSVPGHVLQLESLVARGRHPWSTLREAWASIRYKLYKNSEIRRQKRF